MIKIMRIAKSFTLDTDVSEYVDDTKGKRSASDRVNELLRRAMLGEQYERLETEAAAFFSASDQSDHNETAAFQNAALKSFQRD